jgi:hypothetical protein
MSKVLPGHVAYKRLRDAGYQLSKPAFYAMLASGAIPSHKLPGQARRLYVREADLASIIGGVQ